MRATSYVVEKLIWTNRKHHPYITNLISWSRDLRHPPSSQSALKIYKSASKPHMILWAMTAEVKQSSLPSSSLATLYAPPIFLLYICEAAMPKRLATLSLACLRFSLLIPVSTDTIVDLSIGLVTIVIGLITIFISGLTVYMMCVKGSCGCKWNPNIYADYLCYTTRMWLTKTSRCIKERESTTTSR